MTTHHPRKFPVVLITGTPGCGKTLHSQVLAADSDVKMTHLNIGDIVKQHGFHNGFDEEWKSYIVDEDRLLDYLEEVVNPEDGAAETGELLERTMRTPEASEGGRWPAMAEEGAEGVANWLSFGIDLGSSYAQSASQSSGLGQLELSSPSAFGLPIILCTVNELGTARCARRVSPRRDLEGGVLALLA